MLGLPQSIEHSRSVAYSTDAEEINFDVSESVEGCRSAKKRLQVAGPSNANRDRVLEGKRILRSHASRNPDMAIGGSCAKEDPDCCGMAYNDQPYRVRHN